MQTTMAHIVKLVIFLFTFCFTSEIVAQNNFYKIYTGNGYDYGEGITQSSKDSSYFVTGSSSSFEDAPSQAFILHVDTGGTYIWSKSYGGSASDIGKRIFHIPDEGNYVAGFSNSFGNGLFDFYFFKTDTTGKLLWEKTFGGNSNELLHDAIQLPDTSFILVGQTSSNDTEIEDLFIVRISKHGEIKWQKTFGSSGVDIANTISMIDTNRIIIGGEFYDSDSSKQKAFVLSINAQGEIQWLKTFGKLSSNYNIKDIFADSIYIRGVGYAQASVSSAKVYYNMIVEPTGENYVENYLPQSGSNYFSQIVQYGFYKYHYLAMQPTDNSIIPTYSGGEDLLLCRYKNDLTWHPKCVNGSNHGNDHCNQLIATNDFGAISVGYNVHGGKGGSNVTLIKIGPYDQFPNTTDPPFESTLVHLKTIESQLQAHFFPNPATNELHIKIESHQETPVKIRNLQGVLIFEKLCIETMKIDIESYTKGIYFIEIGDNIQKFVKE